jgi:hypothetical protein
MRRVAIAIVCAGALATLASEASANATRAEYAAEVNPICQAGNDRAQKAGKAFIKNAPKGDGPKALKAFFRGILRLFNRVIGIERTTLRQIAPIAPAPGDEAVVAAFLANRGDALRTFEDFLRVSRRATAFFPKKDSQREARRRTGRKLKRLSNEFERLKRIDNGFRTQLGLTSCEVKDELRF